MLLYEIVDDVHWLILTDVKHIKKSIVYPGQLCTLTNATYEQTGFKLIHLDSTYLAFYMFPSLRVSQTYVLMGHIGRRFNNRMEFDQNFYSPPMCFFLTTCIATVYRCLYVLHMFLYEAYKHKFKKQILFACE